jgi:flagellar basal-body rod protein FlgB
VQGACPRIDPANFRGPSLSLYLFQVAAQKADWLSMRQTAVASNVANASTPGYRAMDLQPFAAVLDSSPVALASTNPAHVALSKLDDSPLREVEEATAEETLSGNTVNLEQEMIKLGDVTRDFSMTANIQRAFHQLLLSALK